jgi:hypothetical protein
VKDRHELKRRRLQLVTLPLLRRGHARGVGRFNELPQGGVPRGVEVRLPVQHAVDEFTLPVN